METQEMLIWPILAPKRADLEVFVQYFCKMIDEKLFFFLSVFILRYTTTEKVF